MILLTTPSTRALDCAVAIEAETGQPTQVADSLQQAVSLLRDHEYGAVVLDECLADADPDQSGVLLQHTGTAVVLTINCAITGSDRMVRELRGALRRREKELQAARDAAQQSLRSDLREPLTAILLDCELALSQPNLPPAVRDKLRSVHTLARSMQAHLHSEEPVLAKD